jgi:hypothetical protein
MSLGLPATHRAALCETRKVGPEGVFPPAGVLIPPTNPSPIRVAIARAVRPGGFHFKLHGVRGSAAGRQIARGRSPDGRNKPIRLAASHAGAGSARTVQ